MKYVVYDLEGAIAWSGEAENPGEAAYQAAIEDVAVAGWPGIDKPAPGDEVSMKTSYPYSFLVLSEEEKETRVDGYLHPDEPPCRNDSPHDWHTILPGQRKGRKVCRSCRWEWLSREVHHPYGGHHDLIDIFYWTPDPDEIAASFMESK